MNQLGPDMGDYPLAGTTEVDEKNMPTQVLADIFDILTTTTDIASYLMKIPYIPYFQTSRYRVQAMIDLADIQPGDLAVDLGTGDGRIAIALAKAGAAVTAYELDDNMQALAQKNAAEAGVDITFLQKDFWDEDLSPFHIVCCYPMPPIMKELEKKLMDELKPGSRVLLNYFPFEHWKETIKKDNVFLYIR